MSLIAVVTTIQPPTKLMNDLSDKLVEHDATLLVAGDAKGPDGYDLPTADFLSLSRQNELGYKLSTLCPQNNYARKNFAYLEVIARGAKCMYETDDDNGPIGGWAPRQRQVEAQAVKQSGWVNVYRIFSDEPLWARGFPLAKILDESTYAHDDDAPTQSYDAPVQQGLHDGNPDADAIWRLTQLRHVEFKQRASLYLPPGSWAPFNSQSTWWWPDAYPLLYMPVHTPPRMPDIWRGYVAMRCLWAMDKGFVFHAPEVFQERNEHDLMKDFRDEMDGYPVYERLCGEIEALDLDKDPAAAGENVLRCYEKMIELGTVGSDEIPLVKAWIEDVETARARAAAG